MRTNSEDFFAPVDAGHSGFYEPQQPPQHQRQGQQQPQGGGGYQQPPPQMNNQQQGYGAPQQQYPPPQQSFDNGHAQQAYGGGHGGNPGMGGGMSMQGGGGGGFGGNNWGDAQQMMGALGVGGVNAQIANAAKDAAMANAQEYSEKIVKNVFPGYLEMMRDYFAVNNSYVRAKLQVLLLPFAHKTFRRRTKGVGTGYHHGVADGMAPEQQNGAQTVEYELPLTDVNAPDLYLPTMAFMTYVIVCAFVKGTAGQFSPDVLGEIVSSCFFAIVLEVGVVRLFLYLFKELLPCRIPTLDLVAYTTYKNVGLVLNMLVGIFLGKMGYYMALLYTGGAMGWFFVKTLQEVIPEPGPGVSGKHRRNWFIYGAAPLQLVFMWYLGYSRDL